MSTTREYLDRAQQGRETDVQAMFDAEWNGEEYEGQPAEVALDELPLSVEIIRHVVITLSTGGPHEELDAELTADGDVRAATFRAYWGSDRVEREVRQGSALWGLAERFASDFID